MGTKETITLDAEDKRLTFADGAQKLVVIGLVLGVVGLGGAAALGAGQDDHFSHFLHSYLVAFAFFLAIVLGALFFVTLQHLTKAGWSVVVRRLAELVAGAMPVFILLALPIIIPTMMGSHALYSWADPEIVADDHLLHHKAPYLNTTFFLIRCVVYFGFWTLLARWFLKGSVKQDDSGDPNISLKHERRAAPAMIAFALTLTYATVDLIMSLDAHWYSTIIGVYFFAASVVSSMATLILLARYLQMKGKLTHVVNTEHYHDLGKLLFAFTFFWAYIAFSQFMLIWYANMPEGTAWYQHRQKGAWVGFSVVLLCGHFIIPFVGLMSRHVKRRLPLLTFWAVWMLAAHWVDMYYLIIPSMLAHGHGDPTSLNLSLMDPLNMIGVFGFFLAAVGMGMKKHKLVPLKDPRLSESLAFENY